MTKYMKELPVNQVLCGDAFGILPSFPKASIDMVMFSPPYWGLRDYKIKKAPDVFAVGGLGLEAHPQRYIERMIVLCKLLRRVLKKTGSMYLNLGDTYYGSGKGRGTKNPSKNLPYEECHPFVQQTESSNWLRPKQMLGMPWRVAIALQHDGWILRNDIIWHKPNHMPSSVKDRLTSSYEHIFHFVKARRYYYDLDAIRRPHKISSFKRLSQDLEKQHGGLKEKARRETDVIRGGADKKLSSEILKRMKKKLIKHDVAVNRLGDVAYIDPLHTKDKHPQGKNPADVIKIGMHHGSSLTKGRATYYEGYLIESDVRGKNPSDTITIRKQPPRPMGPQRWERGKNIWEERFSKKGKNPSDFWSINTKPFPQAHFAVYPEAICVAPIKSSCPLQICKVCGKPRTRISRPTKTYAKKLGKAVHDHTRDLERGMRFDRKVSSEFKTVGWSDCGCGKGFEAGIVLDPMCGAGTTLLVAHKLGRKWIGIDLNPSYVEMAKKRLRRECSRWLTDFIED